MSYQRETNTQRKARERFRTLRSFLVMHFWERLTVTRNPKTGKELARPYDVMRLRQINPRPGKLVRDSRGRAERRALLGKMLEEAGV